jgi:SAM-dependent methyltransferase
MNTEGQWQLTGSAAERYERVLAPAIFAPWAEDLVELAQLQDGERVLDVACGTGVVARHAAHKVGTAGRVTGLDLNQGMVEVARSLPPVPGAAPIIWIEGSALPNGAREALAEEVSAALRPYGDGEGVAFPETANVVMALR